MRRFQIFLAALVLFPACTCRTVREQAPEATPAVPDYTFYRHYHELKVRVAPLRMNTDPETKKTIGHAWTENLVDWIVEAPALTAEAGRFEDFAVWSPSVLERDGKYYMLYTGVNHNACEAICLASSDDLYHWTKHSERPVYVPGDWGSWDESRWSDCRDPFVVKHGGRYYLIFTNVGKGTAYAVCDSILGDWQVKELLLTVDKLSEDLAHVPSCAEVFEYKGNWYISWCTRLPGNEQYLELKEFRWNPDGSVYVGKQVGI